jgi:hypothetical protein
MFTQSEIAVLMNLLKGEVMHLEVCNDVAKVDIQYLWDLCDKDTNKGVSAFVKLNEYKAKFSKQKKEKKQYAQILYKLKKLRSTTQNV